MSSDDELFFDHSEQKLLFVLSKTTPIISIMASSYLIIIVMRDPKKRKKIFHRIMVALSMNSILFSVMFFLQSWAAPKSIPIYGAIGSQRTCNTQGFIVLFSYFAISSYYILLSIFAVYSVLNNFDETWFLKNEVVVHTTLYALPVIISTTALVKGYLNPSLYNMCILATHPKRCHRVENRTECIRGGDTFYSIFSIAFFALCFLAFMLSFLLFLVLIIYVRRRENINAILIGKERIGIENLRKKKSRIIAIQASIFSITFMTTFVLPTVVGFIARYNNKTSIILSAISFVCVSLNGLINLIVYLRLVHRQLDHTVTQLPTIYPQPSTIEQKKCRVGKCLNSLSMSASDFSIFDGTNPSSSRMGQFIDEWSFDEELKPDQDIVSSRINS